MSEFFLPSRILIKLFLLLGGDFEMQTEELAIRYRKYRNALKVLTLVPIISAGDITGAVVFLRNERAVRPFESDIKLAGVAAKFLGSYGCSILPFYTLLWAAQRGGPSVLCVWKFFR